MSNKQIKDSKTKHRWYDVIVAWASGEEIQYQIGGSKDWNTFCWGIDAVPGFNNEETEWRIKPRTVTKRYRMALVRDYGVVSVDITNSSLDDPIEYNIQGFIRWVGDIVEVEIESND